MNDYQFHKDEMSKNHLARLRKEDELLQAIHSNQFELFYQPEFKLKTGSLISVEALVRWRHPQRGLLLPKEFMPLAEESGLIVELGKWILKTGCQQMKTWHQQGLTKARLAINFSKQEFNAENFIANINEILNETTFDPTYLEFELTENILSQDNHNELINQLKNMGIKIVLDDFGPSYTNLWHIGKLPIDLLKIDQAYIHDMDNKENEVSIVEIILDIAKKLRLEVLAKGVETQRQLNHLIYLNCNDVQGFYFSAPSSVAQCESIFKNEALLQGIKDIVQPY